MSELPKRRERVALWDNLKFILILLVVIGHFVDCYIEAPTFQSIFAFIYAVHMPLFILIAGFFHRDERIAGKVTTYLICGFLLKILLQATSLILHQETNFLLFTTNDISWFMFAMAVFILVTYQIRELNKKLILLVVFLVACFAGYDNTVNDFLTWGRIVTFYPFYLLGNILNPNFFLRVKKHYWSYPLGISILVLWGVVCYYFLDKIYVYRLMFTGHAPFSALAFDGGVQTRVFTMLLACILSIGWILLVPAGKIPLISKWGQRTLQVYFWHFPVLKILCWFHLTDICQNEVWGKVLYLGVAVAVTCILSTPVFGFPTKHIHAYINRRKDKNQRRN